MFVERALNFPEDTVSGFFITLFYKGKIPRFIIKPDANWINVTTLWHNAMLHSKSLRRLPWIFVKSIVHQMEWRSCRFYFLDGIILGLLKSLQDRPPLVCFDYQFCFSRQLLLSSGTAMEYQKVPLQFLQKFDSLNPTVTYTHGRTPLVSQLKKVCDYKVSIRFQNKYRWAEKPALFIFASFNTWTSNK